MKLAISLNASTDEQRSKLMPVNRKWNIAALHGGLPQVPARGRAGASPSSTCCSEGVNDTDEDADRLIELLRDVPAKVNLIPYNENPGLGFRRPGRARAEAFREHPRRRAHVAAFIRKNRGRDIAGGLRPARQPAGRTTRNPPQAA